MSDLLLNEDELKSLTDQIKPEIQENLERFDTGFKENLMLEEKKEEEAKDKQDENVLADKAFEQDYFLAFFKVADFLKVDGPIVFHGPTFAQVFKDDKNDSASYKHLKDAYLRVKKLGEDIRSKKISTQDVSVDAIAAIVQLSSAATAYVNLHRGNRRTDTGTYRQAGAYKLAELTDAFFKSTGETVNKKEPEPQMTAGEIKELGKRYSSKTKIRLLQLSELYAKWGKHFAFQEGREREKISEILLLFKPYEEDIKIYEASHSKIAKESDPAIFEIINKYKNYKNKEKVLSFLEKKDEKVKEALKDPTEDMLVSHADEWGEATETDEVLSDKEVDKNLNQGQLAALDRVDRWFLRNYNNAGLLGRFFAVRNHHGEIVTSLLKKTKRERLFMYYLIETGHRKEPGVMDVYQSQTNYIPNLENIKDKMLASKFKLIPHLTGTYTYINKVTEALAANKTYKKLIKDAYRIEEDTYLARKDQDKRKDGEEIAQNEKDPVKKRHILLGEFYIVNRELRDLSINFLAVKKEDRKAELERQVNAKREEAKKIMKRLFDADDALKTDHASRPNTNKADVATYAGLHGSAVKGAGDSAGNVAHMLAVNVGQGLDKVKGIAGQESKSTWGLSKSQIGKANLYAGSITGTSVAAIGNVIAAVAAMYSLYDNAGNMHAGDIVISVTEILKTLSSTGVDVWKSIEAGKQFAKAEYGSGMEVEFSKGVRIAGLTVASTVTAFNAYKTISGGLDIRNANKASDYFEKKYSLPKNLINDEEEQEKKLSDLDSDEEEEIELSDEEKKKREDERLRKEKERLKKKREERYEKNMATLAKKMSAHKTAFGAIDTVISATSVVPLLLPGVGELYFTIGILASTVVSGILNAVNLGNIQESMFDQYMNFNLCYKNALDALEKKGKKIYNTKDFKAQLRRRLAAAAGYSDMASASDQIAKKYATFVYTKLFTPGAIVSDEDREGYIQLVKAFGLKYDAEKKRPDIYHLSRKMSGR